MRHITHNRFAPFTVAVLMVVLAAILTGAFAMAGSLTAEPRLVAYDVDYADGSQGFICAYDLSDLYTFDPKYGEEFDWSHPRRSTPDNDALCNSVH